MLIFNFSIFIHVNCNRAILNIFYLLNIFSHKIYNLI